MGSSKSKDLFLLVSNLAIQLAWLRVLLGFTSIDKDETTFQQFIGPRIITALAVSGLELLNSLLGLTKSKPHQVFLFSATRMGVELLLAPLIPCKSPEHLITVFCWSLDGICRFGCFGLDAALSLCGIPSWPIIKSIRYTVGPLLFPIGAGGEMFMNIRAAKDNRPVLYFTASLWPLFFYPLMKQLLKQRKKYFKKLADEKIKQM